MVCKGENRKRMIEILPFIAALSTVIAAIFIWKVVWGIPLISGYGVGQRKCKITDLFKEKIEK